MSTEISVKGLNRCLFLLVAALLLHPLSGEAQPPPENSVGLKAAFYNGSAFDQKSGIKRLYDANTAAVNEGCCPKLDIESSRSRYEKRRKVLVEPLLIEMNANIERLAEFNEIALFDIAAPDSLEVILAANNKYDITTRLIEFLNTARSPLDQPAKLNLEPSKVGSVDTRIFFDPKRGVSGFVLPASGSVGEFCQNNEKCQDLGKFLEAFAVRNGFSLIVDSSKPLPPNIQKFACIDLTADFIATYNEFLKNGK